MEEDGAEWDLGGESYVAHTLVFPLSNSLSYMIRKAAILASGQLYI